MGDLSLWSVQRQETVLLSSPAHAGQLETELWFYGTRWYRVSCTSGETASVFFRVSTVTAPSRCSVNICGVNWCLVNGTPLQYSCLENPMDEGALWAAVHGVSKESDTTERLHFHFSLSCIGEGYGNPLQCSCLENPRDGEAWWAAVYGVAQSWTRLKRLSSSSSAG